MSADAVCSNVLCADTWTIGSGAVGLCQACREEWFQSHMTFKEFLAFKADRVACLWPGWR